MGEALKHAAKLEGVIIGTETVVVTTRGDVALGESLRALGPGAFTHEVGGNMTQGKETTLSNVSKHGPPKPTQMEVSYETLMWTNDVHGFFLHVNMCVHAQILLHVAWYVWDGWQGTALIATSVVGASVEVDDALLSNNADVAVHSLKDAPPVSPSGLTLAACLPREDVRDAVIMKEGYSLLGKLCHFQCRITIRVPFSVGVLAGTGAGVGVGSAHYYSPCDLPAGSMVGTSSSRRRAQILAAYPHFQVVPLRGSVQTRLAALKEQGLSATLLALSARKVLLPWGWVPCGGRHSNHHCDFGLGLEMELTALAMSSLTVEHFGAWSQDLSALLRST
eukprot:351491-Chlamydomonas_euryale.AAC.17